MSGGPPRLPGGPPLYCVVAAPPDFRPPRGRWVGAGLLGVPVGGGPPASRPRCELRSARRLEARPGPAAAHVHRSQAPQASRRPPIGRPSFSAMSHVIPLHVFQTLKTYRWNCNVLSGARKLTPGNYVRLLFWLTLWPRRIDNETPLNNDAVRGLVLTVIRRPNASLLRRLCTRRSPPR